MTLNLGVVLEKKDQLRIKKKGIKKHQKEPLKLKIFILDKITNKKNMGWCHDINFPKKYNKLFKVQKNISHEKLKRKDYKYDFLIPIKYNFKKPIVGHGSCIFIHLTNDYKPTAGCIALKENDFLLMAKLIK